MSTDQTTQPTAVDELLADGWTIAENRLTGEHRPLAEMRDIITGVHSASQTFLTLVSTDDEINVDYDPATRTLPTGYGSPYSQGSSNYNPTTGEWGTRHYYTCHPWALEAEQHPEFARNQFIRDWPAQTADGSREAYEAACAAAGVPPLSDEQVGSYGNRFMSLDFINDPTGVRRIQRYLSGKRLQQIDDEKKAAADARRAAQNAAFATKVTAGQTQTCQVCGRPLRDGEAMWASLGITCPEHYDDLSD